MKIDTDSSSFVPVTKWNDHFEWPPVGGLRHIIFNANNNGFAPAIKRVGRRVFVIPKKFWEIADEKNGGKS